MQLQLDEVDSPFGALLVVSDEEGALRALTFRDCEAMSRSLAARFKAHRVRRSPRANEHARRLRAYLAGDLRAFDDAKLRAEGTEFQRSVWSALRRIPHGSTATYAEIAAAIGRPRAARAVGAANHANPIAIAIPCHRVIGSNGTLVGYAGGLERKRQILEHERKWSTAIVAHSA